MKNITLSFFIFISLMASAQEFKFGKVSKASFETPQEIEEGAIYLQKYRETFFEYDGQKGWYLVSNIKERIKITSRKGFDYANQKLLIYEDGAEEEKIKKLKAITHNLVDKKVQEDKIGNGAIFENKRDENWTEVSWTMPNVSVGSIIEWEYTKISPFLKIDDLNMQEAVPVKNYEAVIRIPPFFNYNMIKKGFLEIKPEQEFKFRSLNFREAAKDGYGGKANFSASHAYRADFKELVSTFTKTNIPPLKEEPYLRNLENYRIGVTFELASIQYPNEKKKKYSTTWEEVSKSIYKSERFGEQLKDTKYLKDEVLAIRTKQISKLDKMNLAFNKIKEHMSWNGEISKYTSDKPSRIFKDRTGNVADINLMLVNLLREVGLETNPVLLSTSKNGIPLFPTIEGYNYVIAATEIDGKTYLMDTTEKKGVMNILPERTYNWRGRIVKENGNTREVILQPKPKDAFSLAFFTYKLNKDGDITGTYKERLSRVESFSFRKDHSSPSIESLTDETIEDTGVETIENYSLEEFEDLEKAIVKSYDFKMANAVDRIEDKIYLTPLLFLKTGNNPFKSEKRLYPIDLVHPFTKRYSTIITLPKNYSIESLPENLNISLPNGLGTYSYNVKEFQGKITISSEIKLKESRIASQYFGALKVFFEKRIEKENEKITLVKI